MIDKVSIVRLLGVKVTCGDITTYHLISLFKKTKKQKTKTKTKKTWNTRGYRNPLTHSSYLTHSCLLKRKRRTSETIRSVWALSLPYTFVFDGTRRDICNLIFAYRRYYSFLPFKGSVSFSLRQLSVSTEQKLRHLNFNLCLNFYLFIMQMQCKIY